MTGRDGAADKFFHEAGHHYDALQFFSGDELLAIDLFADVVIDHPVIGRASIAELTDFQIVRTSRGLMFIDFELWPKHWEPRHRDSP